MRSIAVRYLLLLVVVGSISIPSYAATCASIGAVQLQHAAVISAESVAAGPIKAGDRLVKVTTAFCRVSMVLKPSADSDIHVEIWLPASGWNGKFQGIGNGGFAGSTDYNSLASAVSHGYAAAATDTGHRAGGTDASWALNHPEKIADFGYRAIHETAANAKVVISAFYGQAPKHSYFNSCSNGGRQALMEAQRYPEDYDGIAAGAPANYWTHLLTTAIFDVQALSEPASAIPASKLPAIEGAALGACDALDGVKDGVIENPAQCHFDPGVLLCTGPETDACLSAPQIAAIRKIYAGSKTSSGELILPGFSPGGEAEPLGWAEWITGTGKNPSLQFAFGTNFFKFMVYNDPVWDYRTSTTDQNMKMADQRTASSLNATDPNLRKFAGRGGKLILYHGWSDAAIPPLNTVNYYQSVVREMGPGDTATFVRLFMVPGWQHCGGGAGVNVFGQASVPRGDADHDIDAALERWVEKGTAPERVVATRLKPGSNPPETLSTRPLCAYPLTAHWNGSGSTDSADNFVCK
ncbi:MAG TPA: tannase/feruloyl esterase family alpha/beta hydrolase [Bryobacteraceae bacterium]|jgi:feruloyl esterase|nr:tannase/feruloyl esterase family alpha/beta hydrolase [Bryobacteraceae bacterium]